MSDDKNIDKLLEDPRIQALRRGVVKGGNAKGKGESLHIETLRRQDKLNKAAGKKYRVVNGKLEKYEAAPPAQDIEAVVASAVVAEKRLRAEDNARAADGAVPGQEIKGRGIFIGRYAPKDRNGNSLGKTFNVYAAPEDLAPPGKYGVVQKRVAGLKDWHGFDGAAYETDKELYESLKKGDYDGEWVIPPQELLGGKGMNREVIQPDNLYAYRHKGALKGTFNCQTEIAAWYWSSTAHPDKPSEMLNVSFNAGSNDWSGVNSYQLSCRLVRLERVP